MMAIANMTASPKCLSCVTKSCFSISTLASAKYIALNTKSYRPCQRLRFESCPGTFCCFLFLVFSTVYSDYEQILPQFLVFKTFYSIMTSSSMPKMALRLPSLYCFLFFFQPFILITALFFY